MALKKGQQYYINNKEFTKAVSDWKHEWLKTLPGEKKVPIPNSMGEYFMILVERYGMRPNFIGYSYIDEMKSDALLSCVKYAHNFNPDKSNNAFAYFTQIIHNAFLQFLNKEKNFADFKFAIRKEADEELAKHDYNNSPVSNVEDSD